MLDTAKGEWGGVMSCLPVQQHRLFVNSVDIFSVNLVRSLQLPAPGKIQCGLGEKFDENGPDHTLPPRDQTERGSSVDPGDRQLLVGPVMQGGPDKYRELELEGHRETEADWDTSQWAESGFVPAYWHPSGAGIGNAHLDKNKVMERYKDRDNGSRMCWATAQWAEPGCVSAYPHPSGAGMRDAHLSQYKDMSENKEMGKYEELYNTPCHDLEMVQMAVCLLPSITANLHMVNRGERVLPPAKYRPTCHSSNLVWDRGRPG